MSVRQVTGITLGLAVLGIISCTAVDADVTSMDSDPPGAYLAIDGPISLVGRAPLPCTELPPGEYRILADGPGLAAARCRISLDDDGLTHHPWAGKASILQPPGITHLRGKEKRGWVYLGAGAVSATMALVMRASVEAASDDLGAATATYSRAVSESAIAQARQDLLAAERKEGDRREVRNLWYGYLAWTWLGAGLESAWLTPQPSFVTAGEVGTVIAILPRASRTGAALRSLLVPGAGQRYLGRTSRADFFLGAGAVLAAAAIASHDALLEAEREQAVAELSFAQAEAEEEIRLTREILETAGEKVDDREILRWSFFGAAAGVYLWNVLDALSIGRGTGSEESDLSWSVAPTSSGVAVCATWSLR